MSWMSRLRSGSGAEPGGPLRRIIANAAVLAGGKAANAVFSLAYLAFTARALGIEAMGLLILVHAYTQTVAEVARVRSWEAVVRFGAPALQQGATGNFLSLVRFTARLDVVSGLAATAIAIAGCAMAGRWLGWPPEIVPAATLYSAVSLFIAPATPIGLLRLFNRFDLLAAHSAMVSFIRMVGAALLLLAGGGLAEFLVVWFVATTAATATLSAFAWRELGRHELSPRRPTGRASAAAHPGLWRFVWITNLNATVATMSAQLPTLMVGGLLGSADAALYRVARELSEALAKPAKILVPTIFPELARLVTAGALQPIRALVRHAMGLAALGTATAFLALWLLGEILLRLVVGETGVPAYGVLLLLGAASLLTFVAFPLEPLLISIGFEASALAARTAATLLHIGMVLLLAPTFGLIGAGSAALSAAILMVASQAVPAARWLRTARVSEFGHFSGDRRHGDRALAPVERGP